MSLTRRLVLGLTAVLGLIWIGSAMITRQVFVHEIDEIAADNLTSSARHLMPLVLRLAAAPGVAGVAPSDDETAERLPGFDDLPGRMAEDAGFMAYEVRDAAGRVILQSDDADDLGLPSAPKEGFVQVGRVLALTIADRATGVSLTIFEPTTHRSEAISEATRALFWPLFVMLPLMAVSIWALARFSLSPILGLSRQIAERGGNDLSPLDGRGQPAELGPIAMAVDRLMDRLRTALDAERVFAGNAAHELRTPIAGALAQAQRLRADLNGANGTDRAVQIEATMKTMADYAEKLLQLSRADAGLGRSTARTNMTPVVQALVQEFGDRAVAPLRIEVQNDLGQDLMVAMDADAFAISLRNLLENAGLHGDADRPVRLIIAKDWTLHVINHGKIVAPQVLMGLKNRHARGDSRAKGSGLGLAIADKILSQSEGALRLLSPATGQSDGFEAIVSLP